MKFAEKYKENRKFKLKFEFCLIFCVHNWIELNISINNVDVRNQKDFEENEERFDKIEPYDEWRFFRSISRWTLFAKISSMLMDSKNKLNSKWTELIENE